MKKKINILALASAFALVGLTACEPADQSSSSIDVCAVTDEIKSIAEKAWNGVATTYADWSSTGVTGNQDLLTTAKKNSDDGTTTYDFVITYSVDSKYAANLRLSSDGKKLEVTCPNSLSGDSDVQAKIHAKVSLKDCSTVAYETDVNVLVKAVAQFEGLADLYKTDANGKALIASGTAVTFNAYYIGMYPEQGAIFGDGDYAIIAYKTTTLPEGTKVGDAFKISGIISDYSGLRELSSSGTKLEKLATPPEGLVEPTTLTLTEKDSKAFKFGDDNRPVDVKGATVVSVSGDGTSSNLTVNVKVGDQKFAVFMNKSYSKDVIPTWKQTRDGNDKAELVKAGDTVSFTGYISAYNNVYQVVYGKVYEWNEPEHSVVAPSQLIKGSSDTITLSFKGKDNKATALTAVSSDTGVVTAVVNTDKNGFTNTITLTALKTGNAKITVTSKANIGEEEKTFTDVIDINVFEVTPVDTTIEDLIGKASTETTDAVWDSKNIYKVSGILEGKSSTDDYGNGYLTDAETGKTIKIYGLSGVANNGFSKSGDNYVYSNPKDAKTSLADVKNGEKVTLHVMFEDYKGVPQICGSVISHEASSATYASTISAGDNGTASLSTTEKQLYGAEVKVTATPNEGYAVEKVILETNSGEQELEKGADGTYAYNVTCKNVVKVTFRLDNIKSGTWTVKTSSAKLPTTTGDVDFSANFDGIGDIALKGKAKYLSSTESLFLDKGKGYIYNTAALSGKIYSIKLTTSSGASATAKYAVTFGTSALSTYDATGAVNIGTGKFEYFYPNGEDATFFQISVDSTKNGQLVSVELNYIPAE